ncbi:MAG: DinB family protein [Acidimicrobiales bacterium]|jgi:uncharacterized damage-inducible protein DinB
MNSADVLMDAFERIRDTVHPAVNGLTAAELAYRPGEESNSIAWLVWHLTRIQDDHVAAMRGAEQLWTAGGWVGRFSLPLDPWDTGYGHDAAAVATVTGEAALLLGYFEEVHRATVGYVASLTDADLDRVVDRNWDPPVTAGVRLVSVIADDLQHAGQAAYVRGILPER